MFDYEKPFKKFSGLKVLNILEKYEMKKKKSKNTHYNTCDTC